MFGPGVDIRFGSGETRCGLICSDAYDLSALFRARSLPPVYPFFTDIVDDWLRLSAPNATGEGRDDGITHSCCGRCREWRDFSDWAGDELRLPTDV
ncbi:hypothetical protein P349_04753 [Enterobacter sp. DC4]|nr:hypothetical protein P349_04753 [Enterobacter sp. DC4]